MRRFFLSAPLAARMRIAGGDARHIARVLRLGIGDAIVVVDPEGGVAKAEICAMDASSVTLTLLERLEADTEAPIEVTLAQCLPKADKMDFIVQKAVELGAARIRPVASENCVVKYDAAKREARQIKWQKIATEAAKQCGRTMVPEVTPIAALRDFVRDLDADTTVVFCYEGETDGSLKDALDRAEGNKFAVLVGPEGGFSPEEAALCIAGGARAVTLGPRILRTETAAIAVLSMVLYHKGDLGEGRRRIAKSSAYDAGVQGQPV